MPRRPRGAAAPPCAAAAGRPAGALGIFRDVSPELLRLRWLRELEADACYAPAGPSPELAPLAQVETEGLPDEPVELARAVLERLRAAARS